MKIIVFCLSGIGDTIDVLPMLKLLRKSKPNYTIDVMTMYKQSKELIESQKIVDNVYLMDLFSKGKIKTSFWLLKTSIKNFKKYDVSINAYPGNRREYNLVSFFVNAKKRIGHDYLMKKAYTKTLTFLHTDLIKQRYPLHNIDENLRLLEPLDIKYTKEDQELSIKLTNDQKKFAEDYVENLDLGEKFLIGIHPGGGGFKNMEKKRWDKDRFAELIKSIAHTHDSKVLLFGSDNEDQLKQYLMNKTKVKPINFKGSVMETAAVMEKCKLVITNDTLILHLAHALKTPSITIFGPTDFRLVIPRNVDHEIVTNNFYCSPCYFYSNMSLGCPENLDYACLKSITVEQVMESVNRMLE
tara:strand:- start:6087 stop:7151 length:1065 start_codon:yes stop_codon:yes gene_type:complete